MPFSSTGLKLFVALFAIAACGAEPPAPPSATSADANAHTKGDPLDESETTEYESDPEIATNNNGDTDDIDGAHPKTLADMLAECGDTNLEQPDDILVDASMFGLRVVREGSFLGQSYKTTIDPKLRIESSMVKSTTTADFTVAADLFIGQSLAEQEVADRKGTHTTEYITQEQRTDVFAQDPAWNGIVCTLQPAHRTINQVGGQNVVTEFDPALPASFSPAADAIRYAEEWQTGARSWQGIKATVRESTNAQVPIGTAITGTVDIRPIEKSVVVADGEGISHSIQADQAFEIRMDFGGSNTTKALGLSPLTRVYIDNTGRTFAAIQSDVGDGEVYLTTFIPD